MRIAVENNHKRTETIRYIIYAIVLLLLSVIHLTMMDFISVAGITPDLIIILIVWIALKEGHFPAIIAGFVCGLFLDIISLDVIGTNALSKLLVGFIAGFFYRMGAADSIIGSYRFIIIVLSCAVAHNLVYFFFYLKPSEVTFFTFFIKYGVAQSLYTTVFAIFGLLVKIPRK